MKRTRFVLLLLIFVSLSVKFSISDSDWAIPGFWQRFSEGIRTYHNVFIYGNLTVDGDVINISVVDYNITGNLVVDNLTVNDNLLANNWSNATVDESQVENLDEGHLHHSANISDWTNVTIPAALPYTVWYDEEFTRIYSIYDDGIDTFTFNVDSLNQYILFDNNGRGYSMCIGCNIPEGKLHVNGSIHSNNWTNVTIDESQVENLDEGHLHHSANVTDWTNVSYPFNVVIAENTDAFTIYDDAVGTKIFQVDSDSQIFYLDKDDSSYKIVFFDNGSDNSADDLHIGGNVSIKNNLTIWQGFVNINGTIFATNWSNATINESQIDNYFCNTSTNMIKATERNINSSVWFLLNSTMAVATSPDAKFAIGGSEDAVSKFHVTDYEGTNDRVNFTLGIFDDEHEVRDNLGTIQWYNSDTSGTNPMIVSSITSRVENPDGTGGNLIFSTGNSAAGANVERMKIGYKGNISMADNLTVVGETLFSDTVIIEDKLGIGTIGNKQPKRSLHINTSDNQILLETSSATGAGSGKYYTIFNQQYAENAFKIDVGGTDILTTHGFNDADDMSLGVKDHESSIYIDTNGNTIIGRDGDGGNLLVNGTLNNTGNATINMIYGEMFFHNDTVGNVTELTEDVWSTVTSFSQHYNGHTINGFLNGTNTLTAQFDGLYNVQYSITFTGTANNKYHVVVGINGEEQFNTETHTRVNVGTDVVSSSGTGFIRLTTNDQITLMMLNEDSDGDATVFSTNLNLVRIGS